MTSRSACAYGRAAATRSCARFIFDVATISIVRVILRVFSTDLMRVLSSLPFAILSSAVSYARGGVVILRERSEPEDLLSLLSGQPQSPYSRSSACCAREDDYRSA